MNVRNIPRVKMKLLDRSSLLNAWAVGDSSTGLLASTVL